MDGFIMTGSGGSGGSVPEPILVHSLAVEDKKKDKKVKRSLKKKKGDITVNAGRD